MFTIEQIAAAHAKVKSGADYPYYVQELIHMGVVRYDTYVVDGRTVYYSKDNIILQSRPKYDPLIIADTSDKDVWIAQLKEHQRGHSDYPTFIGQSAEAGVEQWAADLREMTCTYYDKAGNILLVETIPSV